MLQAEVNGYVCRSTDDYELLHDYLVDKVTYDESKDLEAANKRRLKSYVKNCKNLICYAPNGEIVGVCLYIHLVSVIELVHMYVEPKYRVTYGSGLLNHYMINIVGDNCAIQLKSKDTTTFEKVVTATLKLGVYRINDRARDGLERMLRDRINWKEV